MANQLTKNVRVIAKDRMALRDHPIFTNENQSLFSFGNGKHIMCCLLCLFLNIWEC